MRVVQLTCKFSPWNICHYSPRVDLCLLGTGFKPPTYTYLFPHTYLTTATCKRVWNKLKYCSVPIFRFRHLYLSKWRLWAEGYEGKDMWSTSIYTRKGFLMADVLLAEEDTVKFNGQSLKLEKWWQEIRCKFLALRVIHIQKICQIACWISHIQCLFKTGFFKKRCIINKTEIMGLMKNLLGVILWSVLLKLDEVVIMVPPGLNIYVSVKVLVTFGPSCSWNQIKNYLWVPWAI